MEQIKKNDLQLTSAFLPQLVIANSDTIYMSPTWWYEKADELDKHIVLHSFLMPFAQMVSPWWGPIKGVNIIRAFRL
jgi:nitrate reductase alpha subunit